MAKRRQFDFASAAERAPVRDTAIKILRQQTPDSILALEQAKSIPVDLIDPDSDQFRKHFDEPSLQELAQNIMLQGVLQPIIVEWLAEAGRFKVIVGERRRRAVLLAQRMQVEDPARSSRDFSRIPAIVRDASLIDRAIQQVSENESRQDYSDVERAFAYERLKEILGLTWEELGGKLGLSRMRIYQIRATKTRLAQSVQDDITQRKITERQARRLVLLPPPAQESVAGAIKEHQLTQRQTEALVQRVRTAIAIEPPLAADGGPPAAIQPSPSDPARADDAPALSERKRLDSVVARALAEVTKEPPPPVQRPAASDSASGSGTDVLLTWAGQRHRFDGVSPTDGATTARLVEELDALIAWAAALRDRVRLTM